MPDDNRNNRGDLDNESRQSSGRDSENKRGGSLSNDRERDELGRFESDDSSSRGESFRGSGGSAEEFPKKKK